MVEGELQKRIKELCDLQETYGDDVIPYRISEEQFMEIVKEMKQEYAQIKDKTVEHFAKTYGGPSSVEAVHAYEEELKKEWFVRWLGGEEDADSR